MLYELYRYATDNNLAAKPGYKLKKVKGYVCLDANGHFIGINPPPEQGVLCPDMGSAAQSSEKCNILVEKRLIPLSDEKPKKNEFFLNSLQDIAKNNNKVQILLTALQNSEIVQRINQALDIQKIKPGDIIGFQVDGVPLEQTIDSWWSEFHKTITSEKKQRI